MGAGESRHRIRVLAARSNQEVVERLRRRDGEDRRIDHGAAPFLPVRGRDTEAEAAYPHRRIRSVRIGRAQIEASKDGVLALRKHLGSRKLRTSAVRLERSGEADALGVIAAMAKRRLAALRGEGVHEPVRRKAVRREPPRRVSKRSGGEGDDRSDQRQRSNSGTRRRLLRLRQYSFLIERSGKAYQRSVWRANRIALADDPPTGSIGAAARAPLILSGDCR